MYRNLVLLALLILSTPGAALPAPVEPSLSWSQVDSGLPFFSGTIALGTDGSNAYAVIREDATATFFTISKTGEFTAIGDITSTATNANPSFLTFLGGDKWLYIYSDAAGDDVRSASTTDGGVTWDADNLVHTVSQNDLTRVTGDPLPLSATHYQMVIATRLIESTDGGLTWINKSPCNDNLGAEIYQAPAEQDKGTMLRRDNIAGDPTTHRLIDCNTDNQIYSYSVHGNTNSFDWLHLNGEEWLTFNTATTGVQTLTHAIAENQKQVLHDSTTDGAFTSPDLDDCGTALRFVCTFNYEEGTNTVRELLFIESGIKWVRSTITESDTADGKSRTVFDGALFYVLTWDSTGNYVIWISSDLPTAPVANEIPEFEAGFLAFVAGIGFTTPESQMLFAIILIASSLVIGAVMLRIMASGKLKNGLVAGVAILTGVFASLLFNIDLWMISLSIVLGVFGVQGFKEAQNTFASVRNKIREDIEDIREQPTDPSVEAAPEAEQPEEAEEPDEPEALEAPVREGDD